MKTVLLVNVHAIVTIPTINFSFNITISEYYFTFKKIPVVYGIEI